METTKNEFILINKLIERAEMLGLVPESYDRAYVFMSIEAANEAFNLDLEKMLVANVLNFAHDFIGINNNVVPHQGEKIGKPYTSEDFNFFVPRFAQAEKSKYKKPQHDSVESNKNVGDGAVGRNVEKKI